MKEEIVGTLSGINGSMKEFAMGIESQLNDVWSNKAAAKYGLKPGQKTRFGNWSTFWKDDYDAMQQEALQYLREHGYSS